MDATNLRSEVPIGARVRRDQNRKPLPGRLPDGTLDCLACGSEVHQGSREVFEAYPTAELYRSDCHDDSTILVGATVLE